MATKPKAKVKASKPRFPAKTIIHSDSEGAEEASHFDDDEDFDLEGLHEENQQIIRTRKDKRLRNARHHLSYDFDVNLKKSYNESYKRCVDVDGNVDETAVEHLKSVFSSGNFKFDR